MKFGTEDRKKVLLAGGLLTIAIVLVARWSDSAIGKEPGGSGLGGSRGSVTRDVNSKVWRDPMLRLDALRVTEASRYEASGRDIFHSVVDLTSRRERVNSEPEPKALIKQETVTPFPLTFFGVFRRGNARSIFLLAGDDVFIAREGDVVDRRYKIVRATPNSVEVEDLIKQETQKLWLKDG